MPINCATNMVSLAITGGGGGSIRGNSWGYFRPKNCHFSHSFSEQGPVCRKSRELLGPGKLFGVCYICIQDLSFNNFDNDTCTIKPSVNKAL